MVDKGEGETPPEDVATFYFTRKVDEKGKLRLKIVYRDVQVGFAWLAGEEGKADFERLLNTLPTILENAKKEMHISSTVAFELENLDAELKKLLGGEEA